VYKRQGLYAVSTGGQVTGFGAGIVDPEDKSYEYVKTPEEEAEEADGVDEFTPFYDSTFAGAIVIDDPIKPEDALSDVKRERVNLRFETTIRNRVNSRNTPIIIIMQRVHEHDLCGYLLELEPEEWTVVSLPCLYIDEYGEEKALWPHKHTVKELHKLREKNEFVFDTQYMQNPKPQEGLMYRPFRTYEVIPYDKDSVRKNYTDTADTGSDYLCSICYEEHPDYNYVTDVLYTKKPMEFTEPKTAEMLAKNRTEETNIESNNGGRGFARNVESQLYAMGCTKGYISTFTQTENKNVRIFTHSADVNNVTLFPHDWDKRWPEFYRAITGYRKEGGNSHDDAPDALTGTFEKRNNFSGFDFDKEDLDLPL
jgi:predicted phage terminase large subunit-like protein